MCSTSIPFRLQICSMAANDIYQTHFNFMEWNRCLLNDNTLIATKCILKNVTFILNTAANNLLYQNSVLTRKEPEIGTCEHLNFNVNIGSIFVKKSGWKNNIHVFCKITWKFYSREAWSRSWTNFLFLNDQPLTIHECLS